MFISSLILTPVWLSYFSPVFLMECLTYLFYIFPWYRDLILGSSSFWLSLSGLYITWYVIVSLMFCVIFFINSGVFSFLKAVLAILKMQGGSPPQLVLTSRCHRATKEWNKYITKIMGLLGREQGRLLKRVWKRFDRAKKEDIWIFSWGSHKWEGAWWTELPAVLEEGPARLPHYQLAQLRGQAGWEGGAANLSAGKTKTEPAAFWQSPRVCLEVCLSFLRVIWLSTVY